MKYLFLLLLSCTQAHAQDNNMCIGRFAGASLIGQHHCIIIADHDTAGVSRRSGSLFYERSFWYFNTEKGKQMLAYLDRLPKELTAKESEEAQEYIKKNHLGDIQRLYKLKKDTRLI